MHGTLFATSAIMIAFAVVATNAANPPYGQLSVKNCKLTGSSGQPVQLRGMSLFWSVWMSKYWNQQTIHVCMAFASNFNHFIALVLFYTTYKFAKTIAAIYVSSGNAVPSTAPSLRFFLPRSA